MRISTDRSYLLLIILAFLASTQSCRSPQAGDEKLDGTLWAQTSPEYRMVAKQSYVLAGKNLELSLNQPDWTAAIEQEESFSNLPPAVILDVDETVLDNSAFQARLIKSNSEYSVDNWNAWVNEEKAGAIPGALEFVKTCKGLGVKVFYVTNRGAAVEEATRRNLELLGFPIDQDIDVVLTRNEKDNWGSDKTTRRAYLAKNYRVLLLLGDDLNDFVSEVRRQGSQDRLNTAMNYSEYWGTKWIVLPNPFYGSWEGSLYDFEYSLPRSQKLLRKMNKLRTLE